MRSLIKSFIKFDILHPLVGIRFSEGVEDSGLNGNSRESVGDVMLVRAKHAYTRLFPKKLHRRGRTHKGIEVTLVAPYTDETKAAFAESLNQCLLKMGCETVGNGDGKRGIAGVPNNESGHCSSSSVGIDACCGSSKPTEEEPWRFDPSASPKQMRESWMQAGLMFGNPAAELAYVEKLHKEAQRDGRGEVAR